MTASKSTTASAKPAPSDDAQAIRWLAKRGVDVTQIANEPVPEGVWPVIERVVRRIRGKRRRWFATAAMYGRAVSVLKSGGTLEGLREQFGDPKTLAPLMADPVVRETVFAADLPMPLQRRFTDVLGRTRLRQDETLAVAAELIAHYRSDLASGKTAAEMIEGAESSQITARRLRRATVRQRPWWRRACHWTYRGLKWSLAILCVTYVILLARFFLVKRVPVMHDVQESPDYAAAPLEESAWPLYVSGFGQLEATKDWATIARVGNLQEQDAGRRKATDYLQRQRAALEALLAGARKPRLGRFDSDAPGARRMFEILDANGFRARNPDQALITIGSLLTGAGRAAADNGDWSFALRCFAAPVGIAHQIWAEEKTTPDQRSDRFADMQRVAQELQNLLDAHGDEVDEPALQSALDQLQEFNPDWRAAALNTVQQRNREFISRLYSADGSFTGDGFLILCQAGTPNPNLTWFSSWLPRNGPETTVGAAAARYLLGPCLVPFVANRDDVLRKADQLDELMTRDVEGLAADGSEVSTHDLEIDRLSKTWLSQVRHLPLVVGLNSPRWIGFYLGAQGRAWLSRNVVVMVLAAELHKRRHSAWPAAAEALVPETLGSLPPDEFGRPLRLCIIDDRPVVYAVGYDNVDDTAAIEADQLKAVDPRDIQLFPRPPSSGGTWPR